MTETSEEPLPRGPSELDRVEAFRFKTLYLAGYPEGIAEHMAARQDIDLHRAVELVVDRGCDPVLAAEILL